MSNIELLYGLVSEETAKALEMLGSLKLSNGDIVDAFKKLNSAYQLYQAIDHRHKKVTVNYKYIIKKQYIISCRSYQSCSNLYLTTPDYLNTPGRINANLVSKQRSKPLVAKKNIL